MISITVVEFSGNILALMYYKIDVHLDVVTIKPPNKDTLHGDGSFVPCMEVVLLSEVFFLNLL